MPTADLYLHVSVVLDQIEALSADWLHLARDLATRQVNLHQLCLQGKRHPAEGLLSPRDEEDVSQRRPARRGSDHVTPGPDSAARGGRGRGRGQGGRAARSESDSKRGEQRAAQSGRVLEAPRVSRKADPAKLAWRLFTAERKVCF